MADNKPSISVFFPFYNDWGTVGSLVGLAAATVAKLTHDWEILIINDGSRKEDREALEMILNVMNSKRHSGLSRIDSGVVAKAPPQNDNKNRIKIIHHGKNRGYGGALRTGFAEAKKDLIFYTDCDAQYDPRELTKLYKALRRFTPQGKPIGMVNGYKIKRNDPWFRILIGRIYHYLVKYAFGLPIRDTDCDFRLIRREVFHPSPGSGRTAVRLFENTGTICVELVKKIDYHGYKIAEVPVHHYWRTSGKSQFFNFGRLAKTGVNLLKLWWKLMVRSEYYS